MTQFENVSVVKQANVYFDGKCVTHTVQFVDGSKKSGESFSPLHWRSILGRLK